MWKLNFAILDNRVTPSSGNSWDVVFYQNASVFISQIDNSALSNWGDFDLPEVASETNCHALEKPPIKDATPPVLDKGKNAGDMLKQCWEFLNKHSGTAKEKAEYFKNKLAPLITKEYDGWSIAGEFAGPNGDIIFSGKVGEAVVFDKDGNIYTGKFPGTAFTIGAKGKITAIDFTKLNKK